MLLIEDNLSNVTLVERVFVQRPGVEVMTAMQGRFGLELAREHQPDLILLDLHLPDLGGDHVLQRLRDDPATASIPVVIVSADATEGQVRRLPPCPTRPTSIPRESTRHPHIAEPTSNRPPRGSCFEPAAYVRDGDALRHRARPSMSITRPGLGTTPSSRRGRSHRRSPRLDPYIEVRGRRLDATRPKDDAVAIPQILTDEVARADASPATDQDGRASALPALGRLVVSRPTAARMIESSSPRRRPSPRSATPPTPMTGPCRHGSVALSTANSNNQQDRLRTSHTGGRCSATLTM